MILHHIDLQYSKNITQLNHLKHIGSVAVLLDVINLMRTCRFEDAKSLWVSHGIKRFPANEENTSIELYGTEDKMILEKITDIQETNHTWTCSKGMRCKTTTITTKEIMLRLVMNVVIML